MTGISVRIDGLLWEYTEALHIVRYNWACYLIMTVGVALLLIGFIGCLGAAIESPLLLLMVSRLSWLKWPPASCPSSY